jgi:AP-1 complex subunit gamma-1
MARDVAPEVAALLHSKNSYVRKKAALCSVRIVKKVPDLADEFVDGAGELLSDRHHGVLLCAVTLALELCGVDESHVVHFRKHVSVLVKILMSLIRAGYSAEHDVGGHADPFLQVKLLQLLAKLGAGDADASDAMSDVLANVASNTDGAKNAGNAILYEAVNGEFLLIIAYMAIRELTSCLVCVQRSSAWNPWAGFACWR